jgi:large subunit ribosomal protein L10
MHADKEIIIESLLERINSSPYVLFVSYGGMTVPQFNEIRNRLTEAGADLHVSKNSYIKRACVAAGLPEGVGEHLTGQSAIVSGESDVCAAAKVVKNFAAEFTRPEIRGGAMDGNLLSQDEVMTLANLPSREALLAQFLGVLEAPASKLVRTLNEPATALARVLKAKEEQG